MTRYILQKSKEQPGWWVATDTLLGIVIRFEQGRFNETQKATILDDSELLSLPNPEIVIAKAMRQLADWLAQNHSDTLFMSMREAKNKEKEAARAHQRKIEAERAEQRRIELEREYNALVGDGNTPIEPTLENLSTIMGYLRTVNWGSWILPKLTVGYKAAQYDCDGRIAVTFVFESITKSV